MKKIIKLLSVLALGFILASCSKEAPGKSEVEAGFNQFSGTPPQLSLGQVTVDAAAGVAEVELTISGLSSYYVVGMLSSTDPDFASSNFVAVESPSNGTIKAKAKVAPNSIYYLRAAAGTPESASAYSSVVSVRVPDVPFYAKIRGTYSGSTTAYTSGTTYTSVITVMAHPEDPENKCIITDFNPQWVENGYSYAESEGVYNWLEAVIDSENNTIVIPDDTAMNLGDRTARGLDAPEYEDAGYYDDIYLVLGEDGSSLVRKNAYAVATPSGLEQVFNGTVYAKQ